MENNINCETIRTLAAEAIVEFARTHNTACLLSVEGGCVLATPAENAPKDVNTNLIITKHQQSVGLTGEAWDVVGANLFQLYTEDSKCRTHQKHSM